MTLKPLNCHLPTKSTENAQRLRFALWNAHSINAKDKSTALCDFVIGHQLDILAITETWLTGDDRDHRAIADINNTLPNYVFHHSPRLHSRAGGVGILVRNGINMKIHESNAFRSFEHLDLTLSSMSSSFRLLVVYRPLPNKKNKLTFSMFHDDFGNLAESLISHPCKFLLVGDFNIHMDSIENREAAIFHDLLVATNLKQHVNTPTHDAGHTLDLLITDNSDDFVSSISTNHSLPSDHAAVKCLVNVIRPPAQKKKFCTRKIRSIDYLHLKQTFLSLPYWLVVLMNWTLLFCNMIALFNVFLNIMPLKLKGLSFFVHMLHGIPIHFVKLNKKNDVLNGNG